MKPKERMYIDAKNEQFQLKGTKEVCYLIKGVDEDIIKQRIYDSVGIHTLRIEIIPSSEKVIITYNENFISPTFMDYRFNLKGLSFEREECK